MAQFRNATLSIPEVASSESKTKRYTPRSLHKHLKMTSKRKNKYPSWSSMISYSLISLLIIWTIYIVTILSYKSDIFVTNDATFLTHQPASNFKIMSKALPSSTETTLSKEQIKPDKSSEILDYNSEKILYDKSILEPVKQQNLFDILGEEKTQSKPLILIPEVEVNKFEDESFDFNLSLDFSFSSINENILPQTANAKLAETPLNVFLPTGDYKRVIKDTFYEDKFKFFYRFRTLKEISDFVRQVKNHFNKRLTSLRQQKSSRNNKELSLSHLFNLPSNVGSLDIKVNFKKIGSSKNNDIEAIEFGNSQRERHIFFVSNLRGCEWVTPLALLHSAITLLSRDSEDTKKLLNSVQYHFILIANPDGYEYSRRVTGSKGQHWCKNRRLISSTQSHGVDLAKNFGFPPLLEAQIKKSLTSSKKKKKKRKVIDYKQIYNFSESETKAIKRYIEKFNTKKGSTAVVNLRCCSGELIAPRFYKSENNENGEGSFEVNVDTVLALIGSFLTKDGTKYSIVDRDESFNQKFSGSLIDWAHSEQGINHAYEINLKGGGLTTRTNHNLISEEPFVLMARQLETLIVLITQLLLSQPLEN